MEGTSKMLNLLNILKSINCLSPNSKLYKRFLVGETQVGLVRPNVSKQLEKHPDVFNITSDTVSFNAALDNYDKRTTGMKKVLLQLKDERLFSVIQGWRNECYVVKKAFDTTPLFEMDRSSTCLFGTKNYGVNINGYVKHPSMGLCVWLQKRSATKEKWPGFWDTMAGGGITVGQGVFESACRESMEEASIPKTYHKNIFSTGAVACLYECDEGIYPNTAFVFDLMLPQDFVPKNADGEVESFRLVPARECLDIIHSGKFKKTVIMVAVDFLIRHFVITPDESPYYAAIVEMLHTQLQKLYQT